MREFARQEDITLIRAILKSVLPDYSQVFINNMEVEPHYRETVGFVMIAFWLATSMVY